MKSQINNQEMLLFTNTSFARKERGKWNNAYKNETNSADQLEKACWSGLIFEMLPGIFTGDNQKNRYVWQVNPASQFIHVASGSAPCAPDQVTSINPYFFHQGKAYN